MKPQIHQEKRPGALVIPEAESFFRTNVCGTSIMLRTVCSLGRVVDTVHVLRTPACSDSAARDLESEINGRESKPHLEWADSIESIPTGHGLFVVSQPSVFDYRLCAAIEDAAGGQNKIVRCRRPGQGDGSLWYVGAESAAALVRHLAEKPGMPLPVELGQHARVEEFDPKGDVCEIISDERSRRSAEKKLLRGAGKAADSLIAKHVDRRISRSITRLAIRAGIRPNQLTLMNTALGVLGAGLVAYGTYGSQLAGAVLLLLSIILDGCDGEIARLKFLESSLGRNLDFFLDNVVNALAIFAVGVGAFRQFGDPLYLYASLISSGAALASVWPVYILFFQVRGRPRTVSAKDGSSAYKVAETFNGRDFFYLILFLALIGKLHWFIPVCFAGLLVFAPLVVLLAINEVRRNREA